MTATAIKPKSDKKKELKETLLTPRFYTTDFKAIAEMDISAQEKELRAMLQEMKNDYNRNHFVRDEEFEQTWDHLDEQTRSAFIDFLERSCTSEFSGFILFKEISRRIKDKNPLLSEIFSLMARDEARHAGFLNKAMSDFNISLDLGYLTKNRVYTFFKPEWVIYAVYLSEKNRLLALYLNVSSLREKSSIQVLSPFQKFEHWCQDESRHGDIFNALLRSQFSMWQGWQAKLWSKFFLLSVFATHTLTVHEREDFYESVGLDAKEYDRQVIEKTNNTAAKAFPVILDTNHPKFFAGLEKCSEYNLQMSKIDESNQPNFIKALRKLPLQIAIFFNLLGLYFIKSINAEELRGAVN